MLSTVQWKFFCLNLMSHTLNTNCTLMANLIFTTGMRARNMVTRFAQLHANSATVSFKFQSFLCQPLIRQYMPSMRRWNQVNMAICCWICKQQSLEHIATFLLNMIHLFVFILIQSEFIQMKFYHSLEENFSVITRELNSTVSPFISRKLMFRLS